MNSNEDHKEWHIGYPVGIHTIDRQHKEIQTMIRDLLKVEAFNDTEGRKTHKMMLMSSIEYFEHHFWEEEKIMEDFNYPEAMKHKTQHRAMLRKIKKMALAVGEKEGPTIKSILEYLMEWYTTHIDVMDKEIGEYIRHEKKRRENSKSDYRDSSTPQILNIVLADNDFWTIENYL